MTDAPTRWLLTGRDLLDVEGMLAVEEEPGLSLPSTLENDQ